MYYFIVLLILSHILAKPITIRLPKSSYPSRRIGINPEALRWITQIDRQKRFSYGFLLGPVDGQIEEICFLPSLKDSKFLLLDKTVREEIETIGNLLGFQIIGWFSVQRRKPPKSFSAFETALTASFPQRAVYLRFTIPSQKNCDIITAEGIEATDELIELYKAKGMKVERQTSEGNEIVFCDPVTVISDDINNDDNIPVSIKTTRFNIRALVKELKLARVKHESIDTALCRKFPPPFAIKTHTHFQKTALNILKTLPLKTLTRDFNFLMYISPFFSSSREFQETIRNLDSPRKDKEAYLKFLISRAVSEL